MIVLTNDSSGAACVMPIAKVLNLWDRTLGICIMVLIAIMGLIMMAGCNNIATYCAAQVSALHAAHAHLDISNSSSVAGILHGRLHRYNLLY